MGGGGGEGGGGKYKIYRGNLIIIRLIPGGGGGRIILLPQHRSKPFIPAYLVAFSVAEPGKVHCPVDYRCVSQS